MTQLELKIEKSLSLAKKEYVHRNSKFTIKWQETIFLSFFMGESKLSSNIEEVDNTDYRFAICYMKCGTNGHTYDTYYALFHIGKDLRAEEKWCLGDAEWDFAYTKFLMGNNIAREQIMIFKNCDNGEHILFHLPLYMPHFRMEDYLPTLISCFYHAAYGWKHESTRFIIKQLIDAEMEKIYLRKRIEENNIKTITWNT